MLRKRMQFFVPLLLAIDLLTISAAWMLSYFARFSTGWIEVTKGIPELSLYLKLLPIIMAIYAIAYANFGLYRETRLTSGFRDSIRILEASTLALLVAMAFANMFAPYRFSRLVFLYFWMAGALSSWISRSLFGLWLQWIRKKGRNRTKVLVVGAGALAAEVARRVTARAEMGVEVVGFISRHPEKIGKSVAEWPVLGDFKDLDALIERHGVETVIVALPLDAHERIADTISHLSNATVNVLIVPDLYRFVTLRGGIEEFDGLPIVRVQDTPLYGWNAVLKRAFDIVFASVGLLLLSPVYLALALGVKLSSPGPITYTQERMGLDGRCFAMFKFRSMKVDAEGRTGAVWAEKDDPRRTRFGAFIRRFSLDELPQFFNVLIGDMSVVGPRPERPVFIEQFRKNIPKYMLRHKVRAGVTGWAQVSGLRGNTSLERRIEYDLYYIENWSFFGDIKIIAMTVWRVLYDPNAY